MARDLTPLIGKLVRAKHTVHNPKTQHPWDFTQVVTVGWLEGIGDGYILITRVRDEDLTPLQTTSIKMMNLEHLDAFDEG